MQKLRPVALMLVLSMLFQLLPAVAHAAGPGPGTAQAKLPPVPPRSAWVEDVSLRTATTKHYRAGNYMVAEVHATPIHTRDEKGQWQPIDLSVKPQSQGGHAVDAGHFKAQFTAKTNQNQVHLDLGKGRAIDMGPDEEFEDSATASDQHGRSTFNVKPAKNSVTYQEKNGRVDYEYQVHEQGVKETITLKKYTGKSEFRLPLKLDGLQLRDDQNGGFSLLDPTNHEVRAVIPPLIVFDAAGAVPPVAEQQVVNDGRGPQLLITIDRSWLASPGRQYPVVIDPSVVIAPEGSDLMAATIYPSSYGQMNTMRVTHYAYSWWGSDEATLLKFDLSSIPQGAFVNSALFDVDRTGSTNLTTPINVFDVTQEWYPPAVTWTSPRGQCTTWTTPGGDSGTTSFGNLSAGPVTLTSLVQAWVNRTRDNNGIILRRTNQDYGSSTLVSPTLQVIYALDVIAPTASLSGITNGMIVTGPLQVTVNAQDTAPGGIARVDLFVDDALVASNTNPSGVASTFTVDPRQFGSGNHTVSAYAFDFAGNQVAVPPVGFSAAIPEEPSSLNATVDGNAISLSWDAPVGSGNVTYNLYRITAQTLTPGPADVIATGLASPSYTDTLPASKAERYYYQVSAVTATGVESRVTQTRVDLPFTPGQPQVTPLQQNPQTMQISWPASSRAGVTYNIYRNSQPGFTPSPTTLLASNVSGTTYIDGRNYLSNGSFEQWTPNSYYPNNWNGYVCSGQLSRDATTGKFGTVSAKLTQSNTSFCGNYITSSTSQRISGPITISAWSKAQNVTGTTDNNYALAYSVLDPWGGQIAYSFLPFSVGTHDWEQKSVTITPPNSYTYSVQIWLYFSGNHAGTVWFDGIQVEPGTRATDYQEYGPVPQKASYRVTAVDGSFESSASPESVVGSASAGVNSYQGAVTGTILGDGKIKLAWPAASDLNATYNIYRSSYPSYPTAPSQLVAKGISGTTFVDGGNKVLNSGFESGSFSYWGSGCGNTCPAIDASGYLSTRSVMMTRTSVPSSSGPYVTQNIYTQQSAPNPITISGYSRADSVTAGSSPAEYGITATFYDWNGNLMGTATAGFTPGTHGWERQTATFTPPRPIYYMSLSLNFSGSRTGQVWFDDIQVETGTAASPWSEGTAASAYWYYLVRASDKNGVESPNTNWQYLYVAGGLATPSDLSARNLGSGTAELTWTPMPGTTYAVETATVSATGSISSYTRIATGITAGYYRTGRNLITNPGFEVDANWDYIPDGWQKSGYTNRYWTGGPTGANGYSAYLYRPSTMDPQSQLYQDINLGQVQAMPLTLSGYVMASCSYGTPDSNFGYRLELRDAAGNLVGTGNAPAPTGCTGWQRVSTTVTPTAPATTARVYLLMGGTHTGYAYFDQVQLEGGTQATPYSQDNITGGNTYSFRVVPLDISGNSGVASSTVTLQVTSDPLAPDNPTATSATDGQISVAWTPSPTPNATYNVYRMTTDRAPRPADLVGTNLINPAFTDPGNLITNSGFEVDTDSNGLPDGWTWLNAGADASLPAGSAKFGNTALQLTRSGAGDADQGVTQTITLRQGSIYPVTLSGWSKTTGISGANAGDYTISVRLTDSTGHVVGSAMLPFTTAAHDWEYQSATVTPSAPAARAEVQVVLKGNAIGTALFDGLQLQPGSTATPWVDGPVVPGRSYYYRVSTVGRDGREAFAPANASAVSRSWKITGPNGGPPGLGLDDRWAFVDLPVPGGTGYVNLNTGNLVITATDSVVPGPRVAQVFRRTYNSMGTGRSSLMGNDGWSTNVAHTLLFDAKTGNVTLREGDGGDLLFTQNPDGSFTAPPSVWMTLSQTAGTYPWHIARRDGIAYDFDSAGRMRLMSEPNGNSIAYNYDANGLLVEILGPATLDTTLSYDSSNRLKSVTDSAGRTTQYGYDGSGRLATTTDAMGEVTTYEYDPAGRLASITDANHRMVLFTYDSAGRIASYGWANVPGTTTFSYATDQGHTLTSVTDGLGHTTVMTTNEVGNLIEARDALKNSTLYEYDDWQRLIAITNPRGLVTEIQYESGSVSPRVTAVIRHAEQDVKTTYANYTAYDKPGLIVDAAGTQTVMTYDAAGNLLSQTVASGTAVAATTSYTYTANGMPVNVTDALGNVTSYQVDALGRVTAITNPAGGTTTMTYDAAGNLLTSTDPNGYATTNAYDPLGRKVKTTYPDGGIATWRYDASGLLVEAHSPGNVETSYRYDGAGRLVAQIDGLGNATRFAYDSAGHQILTFYPNGSLERRDVDELGRVVRVYNGENLQDDGTPIANAAFVQYSYDSVGNLVQIKQPNGYTSTAQYDLMNRMVSVTQPPATTSYTYDAMGRTLTVKDGNGKWTRYEYDPLGRLTRVYDALNLTATGDIKPGAQFTAYTYDLLGHRKTVTNPMGGVTSYEYNALGLVTQETDPLGQMTLSVYDAAGRLQTKLDRNGNATNYDYDPMGRTIAIHYQVHCDSVQFIYDAGGRMVSMKDSTGSTYWRYDTLGRMVEETTPNGKIQYEYDANGLRTAQTLAEGSIRYEYDRANRLKRVVDINGQSTTFAYGTSGELLTVNLPGNITKTNTYDPTTNRLTSMAYKTGSVSLSYTYSYDTVGNMTSVQTSDNWGRYTNSTVYYEYDDLNRLTYVYNSGSYTGYQYDGNGDRIREETGNYYGTPGNFHRTMTSYTSHMYSPAGWLIRDTAYNSSGTVTGVTEYAYDGEGNLLSALGPNRTERYSYDSAGHLVKAQTGTRFTDSTYDGLGRRVQRRIVDTTAQQPYYWMSPTIKDSTTASSHYQYDGIYVVAERDGANALRMAFSRTTTGQLLTWVHPQSSGSVSGVYLTDHLGSVVKMVDGATNVALNQYDYDAFGQVTNAQESVPNDMKFTGGLMDPSGLYHLNARFYNPGIGRFITQDTWKGDPWRPWTQNLYVYVGNNPVNYVDPTGHWTISISFGGLIAIGTFGGRFDIGIAIDDDGAVALVGDIGAAQGLAGGLGVSANFSTADTVKDLEGPGAQVGGTLGVGVEAGTDLSGNVYGGLSKEGIGAYVSETYTHVVPLFAPSTGPLNYHYEPAPTPSSPVQATSNSAPRSTHAGAVLTEY